MRYSPLPSLLLIVCFTLPVSLAIFGTALAQQSTAPSKEPPAEGTLLAYVDDDGRLHIVNSIEMIPQQFRARARPAKLGEVSTLSSSSTPPARRATHQSTKRPAPQPTSAQRGTSPGPTKDGASSTVESTKQSLSTLEERRQDVLKQLGLLDEGWMEQGASTEPSVADLERRSAALSSELESLDRAIAKLKASR